jgi:heme exporter protein A
MKNELTVAENLSFWRSFLGDVDSGGGSATSDINAAGNASRGLPVEQAAEAVGLGGILHLPFGYLSAGQQRRMAFAKLLVAYRPVWILDEPTAALDASADILFAELISLHQRRGGIVLAATHQPLGLDNARDLAMTGFAGVGEEIWG